MSDPPPTIPPDRVKELFIAASELAPAERAAFLELQCGDDVALRRAVESLLAANESAGDFLAGPTVGGPSVAVAERTGQVPRQQIGPYKLLQVIGEGGFGTVYLAEQETPVRRRVALKLIKLGMDTNQVIARFEAERQALAIMDHPNIARVFDAGATDNGRPYFVMELVKGDPITQYCDAARLTTQQRLELFIPVCQAVQHAHQKGIIHRDIKPSNVLVTLHDGKPVPKIIDFGIAKATQARLTEKTLFTEFRQMVGTPEYMSPEQAEMSGLDIDTRSDVYSLGVLLYELLTGAPPFDPRELRSKAFAEMQRVIREVDPPRPSTRLSTMDQLPSVAAHRSTEPKKLSNTIRGELDWIVMKCLEKDRTRRYDSASALANDIGHHLADEPVAAHPPSAVYQASKLVRRHKLALGAAALVFVTLAVGLTIAMYGLRQAKRERDEANAQRVRAQEQTTVASEVQSFLTGMLGSVNPSTAQGRPVLVLDVLNKSAASVGSRFNDQPAVESAVRRSIASTYTALGHSDLALSHAQRVLDLSRAKLGDQHRDTLDANCEYALVLANLGRAPEAETMLRTALAAAKQKLGANDQVTLHISDALGTVLQQVGRAGEAEPLMRDTLDRRRKVLGDDHPLTLASENNLAGALDANGRPGDAEVLYRDTVTRMRRTLGEDDPATLVALNDLAAILKTLGRGEEAEQIYRQLADRQTRILGKDHPDALDSLNNLAFVLMWAGKNEEADKLLHEALDRRRRVLGDDHPDTLVSYNNLAAMLFRTNRVAEAEPAYRDIYARQQRVLGDDHPETIKTLNNLALVLNALKRHDEAEPLQRGLVERARRTMGPGHRDTLVYLWSWETTLLNLHRFDEALPMAKELFERSRDAPLDPTNAAEMSGDYGRILYRMKRYAEAEAALTESLRRIESLGQTANPRYSATLKYLAQIAEATTRPSDAKMWRDRLAAADAARQAATAPTTGPATQP
jgi:serine/threonine protein kinase/tetratricopeptide (TPR) repeat protein